MSDCPYCANSTHQVIWNDGITRVMYIDDAPFVGWCRVIWHAHALELTDLNEAERARLMRTVYAVETGATQIALARQNQPREHGNHHAAFSLAHHPALCR